MLDLRFPIGPFEWSGSATASQRDEWIGHLDAAPGSLRSAIAGLSDGQLDTQYRPGGWTVRQVIHHVPDSHMNSYVRFRLALTEDAPVIKTYEEGLWAELPDAKGPLVDNSLCLLECLHKRWTALLRSLADDQWQRTFTHPELGGMPLDKTLALYAWHGRHHVAHITGLRQRMGW